MGTTRREFLAGGVAAAVSAAAARPLWAASEASMYGLIGKIEAVPGQRDALISILVGGVGGMPGCLSYIVARDPEDANAIWVTEVWDAEESHRASLSMPSVQDAIAKGRPLIAGFSEQTVTEPVGGYGI